MEFEVIVVRREGKVIPRWQWAFGKRPRGHLIVEDVEDKALNRITRVARLMRTDSRDPPDPLPLYDATLVHASPAWIVITGFEQLDPMPGVTTPQDFAQSWICRSPRDDG